MLKVNEIFGPSIQGEGLNIGVPSVFLRTAGCSLKCRWCDSTYAFVEGTEMSTGDIVKRIDRLLPTMLEASGFHLVITGGEPLEQSEGVSQLLEFYAEYSNFLTSVRPRVTIETNGNHNLITKFLSKVLWSISPKLPSAGKAYKPIEDLDVDALYTSKLLNSQWKFVVSNKEDQDVVSRWVQQYAFYNVVFQPCSAEGSITYAELIEWTRDTLWSKCYQVRVLPQAHVVAWGQKRGV